VDVKQGGGDPVLCLTQYLIMYSTLIFKGSILGVLLKFTYTTVLYIAFSDHI